MRKLSEIDVNGKCVLMRLDLNVPLKDDKITSDTHIQAALPTIRYDYLHRTPHGAIIIDIFFVHFEYFFCLILSNSNFFVSSLLSRKYLRIKTQRYNFAEK